MKLLFCMICQDVVKMDVDPRKCKCGGCEGAYKDDKFHAWYKGDMAIPLGFANNTLAAALSSQPDSGMGKSFTAFVIPKECPTFEKLT